MSNDKWLDWAVELQAIAQTGLTYCTDRFGLERYQRIREISAEIMSAKTELDLETVTNLFCTDKGYPTPKIDCRAAIFKDGKILMIKETIDGKWSLPGGWVDTNQSIRTNVEKEAMEEAGVEAKAERLIALLDRNKYNTPIFPYGVCKVFVLCKLIKEDFKPNIETSESGYFSLDNLPELSLDRVTKEQISLCFDANKDPEWKVLFD